MRPAIPAFYRLRQPRSARGGPGRRIGVDGFGCPYKPSGEPNPNTQANAMEAPGTWWEASPMSPTDINIVHAAAVHSVRITRRGRRH
jgi:hypothetical protein